MTKSDKLVVGSIWISKLGRRPSNWVNRLSIMTAVTSRFYVSVPRVVSILGTDSFCIHGCLVSSGIMNNLTEYFQVA